VISVGQCCIYLGLSFNIKGCIGPSMYIQAPCADRSLLKSTYSKCRDASISRPSIPLNSSSKLPLLARKVVSSHETFLPLRLPRHHQVHGREQLLLPTRHQRIRCFRQAVRCLLRPLARDSHRLQHPDKLVNRPPSNFRQPRNSEDIPHTPNGTEITREWIIPGPRVRPIRQILVELEYEARGLYGGQSFRDLDHVRDAVTLLDVKADSAVVGVVVVVGVGHKPFVDAEDATRFEDAVDLGVDAFEGGGVDGGFDGVDGVEGVFGE